MVHTRHNYISFLLVVSFITHFVSKFFLVHCIIVWYAVPSRSSNVENLLEMSDKAKLSDHDMVLLINGLIDKLQNADLKHSVVWTQVC